MGCDCFTFIEGEKFMIGLSATSVRGVMSEENRKMKYGSGHEQVLLNNRNGKQKKKKGQEPAIFIYFSQCQNCLSWLINRDVYEDRMLKTNRCRVWLKTEDITYLMSGARKVAFPSVL